MPYYLITWTTKNKLEYSDIRKSNQCTINFIAYLQNTKSVRDIQYTLITENW